MAQPATFFSSSDSEPSSQAPGLGSGRLIIGDVRKALAAFEDGTFATCVTSPPYWGLRDYGIAH
ncbi:MAG TPA: hypothetical protein VG147_12700, partial [Solirubrobacteraceae bacterium]|nr:hypothetical protein [Solirubrobacteraceae bacterium]